ncbi:MAG: S41 family peptidase [Candidatus Aminicenantia bacterium]
MKRLYLIFIPFILISSENRINDPWEDGLKIYSEIISTTDKYFPSKIDYEELVYNSIRNMLLRLDPHSSFLDPKAFANMKEDQAGKFYGLGITIQKIEERLIITSVIEGGPAWKKRLRVGDIITHVDGEPTKDISASEAVRKLRGAKGTEVKITILRKGMDKPFDITIVREEIPYHSVNYYFMINKETGYISLRNFSETTTKEFEEAVNALKKEGMKSLILDLRWNPGGSLTQAVRIADEFLPKGKLVVFTKGRDSSAHKKFIDSQTEEEKISSIQNFYSEKNGQLEDIPLVIVINSGSASASEIVAGALQDHDRAIIVGTPSWGKGLVQTPFMLSHNTALVLTTAKYYTPTGRSIQRDYTFLEDYFLYIERTDEEINSHEFRLTSKGRKVYAGGGIIPDVKVEPLTYPSTVSFLRLKGAFFDYANRFLDENNPLLKKYLKSKKIRKQDLFESGFTITYEIWKDWLNFLKESNLRIEEKEIEKDKKFIIHELLYEIFSQADGFAEGAKYLDKYDPQILKAIESIPKAYTLLK